MKERQTITFSQSIYNIAQALRREERLIFYEQLIDYFLGGKEMTINQYSESLRVALACATPQMRVLQSKFNNGNAQKIFHQNAKGLLCPSETSEIKLDEAKISESNSRASNFNNLDVTNINIYNKTNKLTNSDIAVSKKPTNDTQADERNTDREKILWCIEVLKTASESLESTNPVLRTRFMNLVKRIAAEPGTVKVYGKELRPISILEKYVDIFRCDDCEVEKKLNQAFTEVDEKADKPGSNVKNKYKYLVTVMYALATGL